MQLGDMMAEGDGAGKSGRRRPWLSVRSAVFWARLGWAGLSPIAPGSVATALVGIPCAWVLACFPEPFAMGGLMLLFFTACFVSDKAAKQLGRKDPGEVVIDELVGFLVTMVGLPMTFKSVFVGFVAFRLLDIWKPWPVRCFDEQLEGGLGIVVDDVAAGCYAHGVVWVVLALWP
jgi:phosphatidylglycerophosphatase A